MGSDWVWELHLPDVAAEPALRRMFELAAIRDLRPYRPDGLINLFDAEGDWRTVTDFDVALAALAGGPGSGQLWTADETDISVTLNGGRLTWSLSSAHCYRMPLPEADPFRRLHQRLTDLWLELAQDLGAEQGRILDEWSTEQIWSWGLYDAVHPIGGWPAELGWWTYLKPDDRRRPPPLPEIAARAHQLPNGGLLVSLLDDPAAVDVLRYQDIHQRWTQARVESE